MKTLLKQTLIILIVFFISYFAEAAGIGDLFDASAAGGACNPKKKEDIPNLSSSEIAKKGDDFANLKYFCKAVQYYKAAQKKTSDEKEINTLSIKIIESYFYQYDYEKFFDESFLFLSESKEQNRFEYVQYLMLKGVTELSRLNKNANNPYLQYSLGASPEQFNQDSPKHLLKYRNFLEKYPNSQYGQEVSSWLAEMKHYFNVNYAKEVRIMVLRREYAPAISRFQFLLSQGPALQDFTLIVYECIKTMREFAELVTNENAVASSKLARWLVTTEDKVSPTAREMVQRKLFEQSEVLLVNLIEKFPEDRWSIKAQNEFRRQK